MLEILQKLKKELQSGKLINLQDYETGDQKIIKQFQLLCSKPTFYIANIDDSDNSKKHFNELEKVAKDIGSSIIPASIKIEQEISLLQDDEKLEYLELLDMDEPVLNKIIFEGYKMLGLKTFFKIRLPAALPQCFVGFKYEEALLMSILGHRPEAIVLTGGLHSSNSRNILNQAGIPVVEI